jgi:hypothetical protein
MTKARINPAEPRSKARTAARPLDHEAALARHWVLATAFAVLLAIMLAQIGG